MDLGLFNPLRGRKGLLADFHRWRRRRLGRSVAWQPCLLRASGCDPAAPAPHHCLLCFCSSFQLQPSRKATGGAGDEEETGEWAMPQVRLLGEKQGLLDPQDLSPHHWGSQTAGILSHSRVSSITVSDLQCGKENIHTLCSPYSPAFHTCTFEIPFTPSFPSTLCIWHILSCLHPQIHNPPPHWLGSERLFLATAAFVGRRAHRGMQQASCRFFVFWQTSLEDFAPPWARRGTGRCCASFPRSAGRASPISPATTAPPGPSSLSPRAQASAYLEQRELSLPDCVVVFWCEQMGLGGQATSVRWILPPSQLFANGWKLGEAGKLWVWAQNALFL